MEFQILGGGWVTAAGYGLLSQNQGFHLKQGKPVMPPAKEIFTQPLSRYGRFDDYTKLGCAGIALALKDAQLDKTDQKRPIGVVVSTVYECFESDIAFNNTTKEEEGFYASPNLFSYTLPGIVIGESAIHFKLTGPTFTVGDSVTCRGYDAVVTALELIRSESCETVVTGWLDGPNQLFKKKSAEDDGLRGALFVVLSAMGRNPSLKKLIVRNSEIITDSNHKIRSIIDLF